jgi:hypothetical protein
MLSENVVRTAYAEDVMRAEIRTALEPTIPVAPVLLQGAAGWPVLGYV